MHAHAAMSLSYAQRLARRKDLGGALGDPEVHEDVERWSAKCETLARWWSDAKHVVVYTGCEEARPSDVANGHGHGPCG